jgi:hypothetical protein
LVGKPEDLYDRLRAPLGNLFFAGEAVSVEHQGSVHGAYSAGVMAAENCQRHLLKKLGDMEKQKLPLVSIRDQILKDTVPLQISRIWNISDVDKFKKWKKGCISQNAAGNIAFCGNKTSPPKEGDKVKL